MITAQSLLVTLVKLVDSIPVLRSRPSGPGPAESVLRSPVSQALIIMLVRHLRKVHELLAVLAEPTAEMQALRALLMEHGRYPTRRTWERRLKAMRPRCRPDWLFGALPGGAHPTVARLWPGGGRR